MRRYISWEGKLKFVLAASKANGAYLTKGMAGTTHSRVADIISRDRACRDSGAATPLAHIGWVDLDHSVLLASWAAIDGPPTSEDISLARLDVAMLQHLHGPRSSVTHWHHVLQLCPAHRGTHMKT